MGSITTHQLQENEDLVCGTCGDEGFTNAFVYCVKCLEFGIHRYCLDEMPKTFNELVIWCCEHCQVKSSQSRKQRFCKLHNDPENGIQESCTMVDFPISTSSKMKHKELISDSSFMGEESEKNNDHECRAGTGANVYPLADIENNTQDNYYTCAQPDLHTVWRWSFTVTGAKYDSPGTIFVYLSTKACDKAFQEANMMPSLLHLEMHSKTFLWPESFQEREPSDDSIALYFFPGDAINEKIYDHLVQDMMDKELAMRVPTKNADLLIFTSVVLPHFFQRFQGKYYLWGVFRNKSDDPASVVSHNLTVPNSNDERALLNRVDVAVQPFVEHLDNPMG